MARDSTPEFPSPSSHQACGTARHDPTDLVSARGLMEQTGAHQAGRAAATRLSYRRDVDGLRALAVMPVVFFHAGIGPFTGGYTGVDVFFVISGFLITSLLLKDLERGTFSIAHFYERRARRILPALTFVAAAVAAVAIIIYPPAELTDFGKRLASTALFVANIHFWRATDYFAPRAEDLELLHVWSLAVEEQFYLFFPPLLWLAVRLFKPRHVPWLFAAAASLSFLLSVYGLTVRPVPTFYLLPTRAWELLLGALIAFPLLPAPSRRAAQWLGIAAIVLLGVATFGYDAATPFPGAAAFVPCLGAAMLLYSGRFHADTWVARALSARPLVGFGLISYSLYLWHWPLLVMSTQFLMRPLTTVEAWAAILASVLLAAISWKFVEAPFRRPVSPMRSSARPLAVAAAAIAGLALVGVALSESRGLPWRVSPEVRRLEATAEKSLEELMAARNQGCVDGANNWRDRCRPTGISVVLWGDSHAGHFVAGLRERVGEGRFARYGNNAGCPPLLGITTVASHPANPGRPATGSLRAGEECRKLNDETLRAILARPDVRTVMLAGAWQFYSDGIDLAAREGRYALEDRDAPLSVESSRRAFRTGLTATVQALRARGIRVVLFGDTPQGRTSTTKCLIRALTVDRNPAVCDMDSDLALQLLAYSDSLVDELGNLPGVVAFKPSDHLCRDRRCPVRVGLAPIYLDADHLTLAGADYVLRKLDSQSPGVFGGTDTPPKP